MESPPDDCASLAEQQNLSGGVESSENLTPILLDQQLLDDEKKLLDSPIKVSDIQHFQVQLELNEIVDLEEEKKEEEAEQVFSKDSKFVNEQSSDDEDQ